MPAARMDCHCGFSVRGDDVPELVRAYHEHNCATVFPDESLVDVLRCRVIAEDAWDLLDGYTR